MKYRGRIEGGLVVLDQSPSLRDGTIVDVEPISNAAGNSGDGVQPTRGSARVILRHAGIWSTDSEEVDRLLAEIRDAKEAELAAQIKSEKEGARG